MGRKHTHTHKVLFGVEDTIGCTTLQASTHYLLLYYTNNRRKETKLVAGALAIFRADQSGLTHVMSIGHITRRIGHHRYTRFSLSMEMSRLTRDGTAEPVSRDQILRRERGRNIHFSCSADHEQDWQPYPVVTYSCYCCICVTIHAYIALLVYSSKNTYGYHCI